jgi:hypothetical protein
LFFSKKSKSHVDAGTRRPIQTVEPLQRKPVAKSICRFAACPKTKILGPIQTVEPLQRKPVAKSICRFAACPKTKICPLVHSAWLLRKRLADVRAAAEPHSDFT